MFSRNLLNIEKKILTNLDNLNKKIFLHTSPHHDDAILGYLPLISDLISTNKTNHYFATATKGFNGVRNSYLLEQIENLESLIEKKQLRPIENIISSNYDSEIQLYLLGLMENNNDKMKRALALRTIRNLIKIYNLDYNINLENILNLILEKIK